MTQRGIKGLLVAVVALLVLDLAAQFSMSFAKAQETPKARVVSTAAVSPGGGDYLWLFRTFDDGRTEVSPIRVSKLTALPGWDQWSPWNIKDVEAKPKQ